MKIVFVVGHDSINQGAYGNSGISEFEFNTQLMQEMTFKRMFPSKHEVYVIYRDSSIKGYYNQMVDVHERIDAIGGTVAIELHFNSFPKEDVNGNEVLYYSQNGKKIADIFDEELDALPNRDRGVKALSKNDRGYWFCRLGKAYAIILEPFFGSHQKNYDHYGVYRDTLMKAIENALKRI